MEDANSQTFTWAEFDRSLKFCNLEIRQGSNNKLRRRCYFAVEPRVMFTTRQLLPATKKDVFPTFQHSNIIYQY